jgi:hypothetical protein
MGRSTVHLLHKQGRTCWRSQASLAAARRRSRAPCVSQSISTASARGRKSSVDAFSGVWELVECCEACLRARRPRRSSLLIQTGSDET